jgi:uncharacterized protein (DUF433 family)
MELPDFLTRHQYGEIRITGHRIDLLHLVDLYNNGHSVKQMAEEDFDTLSVELLQNVIDFYLANKAEVDAYVARCRADIDRQMAAHVPSPEYRRIRKVMEERGIEEPL